MRFISFLFTVAAFLLVSSVASSAFSFSSKQHQLQRFGANGAVALPPAPANLLLDETLFNKLTAAVVPVINQLAASITIPAINSDHFDIDAFNIENFDLGPITFAFISPNKVSVALTQISFNIPSVGFELKDKILFVHVHCHGHADASVYIAASFSFDLTDTDGKIALAGATAVNIDYKTLHVGYKMDHTVCKIVSKLINFVIGGITDKIKDAIEKNLGPAIQKSLTGALEKAFAKLPVTVTGSPSVTGGVLSVPINLASFIHQQQKQQQLVALPPSLSSSQQQQRQRSVGDLTRDLAVQLPASSANVLSEALFAMGKLHFNHTEHHVNTSILRPVIPAAYNICPSCPINIDADAVTVPRVAFTANNFSLSVANLSLSFKAFNQSTGEMLPLFTVSTNVGFSVGQFAISTNATDEVIKFALGVQNIDLVVTSSSVGKIDDVSTINFIINVIVNTVVPTFNKAFPGIPVPTTGGFALTDIFIQIGSGSFQAGFDVKV